MEPSYIDTLAQMEICKPALDDKVGKGFDAERVLHFAKQPESTITAQSMINAVLEPIEMVDDALRRNYKVRRILMQEAMEQLGATEDRINSMLADRLEENHDNGI